MRLDMIPERWFSPCAPEGKFTRWERMAYTRANKRARRRMGQKRGLRLRWTRWQRP